MTTTAEAPGLPWKRWPYPWGGEDCGYGMSMTCSNSDPRDAWVVHGERAIYESDWVTVGLADISQPSGDRFEHHTVSLPRPL